MLCLTRREGQRIRIRTPGGETIWVVLVETERGKARIGIDCPRSCQIEREELIGRPPQEPPRKEGSDATPPVPPVR